MIPPRLFPIILIVLQAAASCVYGLQHGDWRRAIYWAAGAVITAAVTF